MSNVALAGMAGALSFAWAYRIKTGNAHLKETGELKLETLLNTFLVYAPIQLIAGRQRPGEGDGYGDFSRHHNINTSFLVGHPMFTMAMATVVAHEYPRTWVKLLAYGTAVTVVAGRFLAHDHWASDELVGTALGYFIGAHIFRLHCRSEFNEAGHPPRRTAELKISHIHGSRVDVLILQAASALAKRLPDWLTHSGKSAAAPKARQIMIGWKLNDS